MNKADFRPYVPDPGNSPISGPDARSHGHAVVTNREPVQALINRWKALLAEPFRGMTSDGNVIRNLYEIRPEGAPTNAMVDAATALLARMSEHEKAASCFSIDSNQRRNWQNTELYIEDFGLRLDETEAETRDAALAVIKASLSADGYEKTRNVMKLNRFLGDLVHAPEVMGEFSYTFCLFGEPSTTEPWGWQLFGHHLTLNCFILGDQMTITPTFMGAEPSFADDGPFKGISLFEDEERLGLDLRRSLNEDQAKQAHLYQSMMGGDMPSERRQFADQLHYGGAYQDNRVIAYEGIRGENLSKAQQQKLLDLTAEYVATLPPGPLGARMEDVERHIDDTHFCWIGATDEVNPFYYRVQSPVVMIELDHHAGVYLTNTEPQNFHVHTLVRTPNGNDYGLDLLRLHYENAPHHKSGHSHGHKHD